MNRDVQRVLRQLPSVDALLGHPAVAPLITQYGRPLVVEAFRHVVQTHRKALLATKNPELAPVEQFVSRATQWLGAVVAPTLRPVINATGVIVHTNLGRAPLSDAAQTAVQQIAHSYNNLEFDLPTGKRGSRAGHTADLLTRITGAEDAFVVNNTAAAVLLTLSALCPARDVIVSRGQLIEIGGGFRVPDVMVESGAHLVEVGTTNRTHLQDYAYAISGQTGAIFVAHHSNYKIVGFTAEPSLAELAELVHTHHIPLIYDQGSGALVDTTPFGLDREPTAGDAIAAGADVVMFSGDKLLGGPQAGIICGRRYYIDIIRKHPLARAVRADKLCLAGLAATLTAYVTGRHTAEIPVWQMISRPVATLAETAHAWAEDFRRAGVAAEVREGYSTVGGGSVPGTQLPTVLVALPFDNCAAVAEQLRALAVPIVGRVQDAHLLLDPRTVLPHQEPLLRQGVLSLFH